MERVRGDDLRKTIERFSTDMTYSLKNLDDLIAAIRRYPTNEELLFGAIGTLANYSTVFFKYGQQDGVAIDLARAAEVRDLAITCAERVLKYSDDLDHIMYAYYWMIDLYVEWEQFDKAEAIAMKFPTNSGAIGYDRNSQLAKVVVRRDNSYESQLPYRGEAVIDAFRGLMSCIRDLTNTYAGMKRYGDALAVAKYVEDLMPLTLPGEPENYYGVFVVEQMYLSLARYSAECGDYEGALAYLEKHVSVRLAMQERDVNHYVQPVYKTPLFKNRIIREQTLHYDDTDTGALEHLRAVLASEWLDPVRDDARFVALTERVERDAR